MKKKVAFVLICSCLITWQGLFAGPVERFSKYSEYTFSGAGMEENYVPKFMGVAFRPTKVMLRSNTTGVTATLAVYTPGNLGYLACRFGLAGTDSFEVTFDCGVGAPMPYYGVTSDSMRLTTDKASTFCFWR